EHGAIDLRKDMRPQDAPGNEWRNYLVTSPPVIIDGKVVIGSSIGDNRGVQLELGTVRAFDARSGKLLWGWDPIPRDPSNPVYKDWNPQGAKITGAASPDFFGGERSGSNRWANSIVALDAATGKLKWAYQLVHHDLWDYDLA